MAIDIYDTVELVRVIENFEPIPSFWLDRNFRFSHFSETEYIDFDLVDKPRRLAPFVVPNVQGQPMLQRKEFTRRFKPAYLKPKDPVDARRALRRRAGESIGGSMSPGERIDAVIGDILNDHSEMIDLRFEWMAAKAVIDAAVTISGENYPTRTVAFGRDAQNTVTLSGTARWGQSAADPLGNIKAWATILHKSGKSARDLIMDPDSATAFFADPKVEKALETRRGSQMQLESYNVSGSPVVFHGTLPGGVNVWTYNDTYEDNDGVEQPFLASGTVVLLGDVEGTRCFGAIMDDEADWAPLSKFPKMWQQKDPSGIFIMTQSAPLMVPGRPNSSLKANVL